MHLVVENALMQGRRAGMGVVMDDKLVTVCLATVCLATVVQYVEHVIVNT
jgi:hypothetical protein